MQSFHKGVTLPCPSQTNTPNPGHNASQIWVSIDQGEMTLQQAIENNPKGFRKTGIFSGYTNPQQIY